MMSARLISVPAGGSGSPLTGRNVLQFPGRFTEEMMVIGRVGVEIRAPRLDGVSRSSPASVNWCSVLYTVARDTEIGAPGVWSDSPTPQRATGACL
jgi:hypothetical protein